MKKNKPREKKKHHPRNRFEGRYDLEKLSIAEPEFKDMIIQTERGDSLDFSNPDAVESLNRSLLKDAYGLPFWKIPKDYLCPPVPGRLDYVHTLADILANSNDGRIPKAGSIKILDIGTGASLIYPLLIQYEYGWEVVASDVNDQSLEAAQINLENSGLKQESIIIRKQDNSDNFFKNIILPEEYYDFTLCNPPFYKDSEEAEMANKRKNRNIHPDQDKDKLRNFGGADVELIYPGGEKRFLSSMIRQSRMFGNHVLWFSSLVSSQSLMSSVKSELALVEVKKWDVVDLSHGNKKSRMVYWTFLSNEERKHWKEARWK